MKTIRHIVVNACNNEHKYIVKHFGIVVDNLGKLRYSVDGWLCTEKECAEEYIKLRRFGTERFAETFLKTR